MKNIYKIVTGIFLFAGLATQTVGQVKIGLEFLPGDAFVLKTPLTIKQDGFEDIKLNAKYKTHGFNAPLYYSVKLHFTKGNRGWEAELIHLKLMLDNRPPEVEKFNITHGFNCILINRIFKERFFTFRMGAGVVVTHPENTIRGKSLNEDQALFNNGYYFSGPIIQFGINKRLYILKFLYFNLEAKLTGAYTRVPVVDGHANVSHLGVHGLFGFGISF